jgi:hypothetical protein
VVIVRPGTPEVIHAVIAGIETSLAPDLAGAPAQLAAGMAVQVLRTAAVRSGNEVAWMREEANAIEHQARRLIDEIPHGHDALASALQEYVANRTDRLYLADALVDYELVSEVLSCAAELAYVAGSDEHRCAVHRLFEQRLVHENVTTGGYQAVGRT